MHKISWTLLWGLLAAVAMISCGGTSNPVGPSAAGGGLTLQGVVLGGTTGASAQPGRVGALAAGSGQITVSVQGNSSISTSVSSNGTFELSGLSSTSFTLVFSVNGKTVGTITVNPTQGATQIHLVVKVTMNSVSLVSVDNDDQNENEPPSTCIIEGGKAGNKVELEGTVSSGTSASFMLKVEGERSTTGVVTVTTSGTTQFKCGDDDNSISGTTCAATLKTGAKVHVRGTLTTCTTTAAAVTATQVSIQKGEGDD